MQEKMQNIAPDKDAPKNESAADVNAAKNGEVKNDTTTAKEKDYTPKYSDEEREKLSNITKIVEEEINAVLDDEDYAATPISGGNAVININAFIANGGILAKPVVNRVHGKDEDATGESIMSHGAHHPFIVVTRKMADAAGFEYERFANDPVKEKISDEAKVLIVLDGNGRTNFLYRIEHEKWPIVNALFPQKNRAGVYDLPTCMTVINTELAKWKTQDLVQKRIITEGASTHEGWKLINELTRQGFGYQSACQIATLKTDRIVKTAVCTGNVKDIFLHYESAKQIYEVLKIKFVKDLGPLKTKELTREISSQWNALTKHSGDDMATENYIKFLNEFLTNSVVEKIQNAKAEKSEKGKISKDEVRKETLQKLFYTFVGKYGLKID